jgi:hypothetical protein
MRELSESDQKPLSDIERVGWHIIHISEDEDGPGWSFTVGLYHTFKHPEIVITGFNHDLCEVLLNNFGHDIKSGKTFVHGEDYSDVLDDVKCRMLTVKKEHYDAHFGYANWFYKSNDFPVLQCVCPTVQGVFPWDEDAPEGFVAFQPLLCELKK